MLNKKKSNNKFEINYKYGKIKFLNVNMEEEYETIFYLVFSKFICN